MLCSNSWTFARNCQQSFSNDNRIISRQGYGLLVNMNRSMPTRDEKCSLHPVYFVWEKILSKQVEVGPRLSSITRPLSFPSQPNLPFPSSLPPKGKIRFWPNVYWNWSGELSSSLLLERDCRFQFLKRLNLPPFTDEEEIIEDSSISWYRGRLHRRLRTIDETHLAAHRTHLCRSFLISPLWCVTHNHDQVYLITEK